MDILFEQVIYGDPFRYHISEYLNPIDLYNLKYLNKYLYKFIDKNILDRCIITAINTRLYMIFKDKLSEFKNILKETKSVISGSFILQCILNETYKKSDIDIYFPSKDNTLTENLYTDDRTDGKYPYSLLDTFMRDTMKLDLMEFVPYHEYPESLSTNDIKIEWIRNYNKMKDNDGNNDIQIIYSDIDKDINKIKSHIFETYDFDICKNMYYIDNCEKLIIHSINDIFTRTTILKPNDHYYNISKRYKKYTDRNFNIINNLSYTELFPDLVYGSSKFNPKSNTHIISSDLIEPNYYETHAISGNNIKNKCKVTKGKVYKLPIGLDITKYHMHGSQTLFNDLIGSNDNYILFTKKFRATRCKEDKCKIRLCDKNIKHFHKNTTLENKYAHLIFINENKINTDDFSDFKTSYM